MDNLAWIRYQNQQPNPRSARPRYECNDPAKNKLKCLLLIAYNNSERTACTQPPNFIGGLCISLGSKGAGSVLAQFAPSVHLCALRR